MIHSKHKVESPLSAVALLTHSWCACKTARFTIEGEEGMSQKLLTIELSTTDLLLKKVT